MFASSASVASKRYQSVCVCAKELEILQGSNTICLYGAVDVSNSSTLETLASYIHHTHSLSKVKINCFASPIGVTHLLDNERE